MAQTGCLYIVATPIGDMGDITLRAIETLRKVDGVICEEARVGTTLLKKLEIPIKELILLNEHNEQEQAANLVIRIAKGESFALISDCGTPVFADPGAFLVQQISQMELPVVPIPGASSLMAALSVLDFKLERFVYAGFLPRDPVQRRKQLESLRYLKMATVVMDTPYRLAHCWRMWARSSAAASASHWRWTSPCRRKPSCAAAWTKCVNASARARLNLS